MLEWIKDIGVIIGSLIAAIFLFLPQIRKNRPWIAAALGIVAGLTVTGIDYYLRASTNRGLQDRAACFLFPAGQACSQSQDGSISNVQDDFVITQEFLDLPKGQSKDVFLTDRDSIDSAETSTYCRFIMRNVANTSVVLQIGTPNTDNISTLTSLLPGERHEVTPQSINAGFWIIFDTERRFHFTVNLVDKC